MVADGDGVIPHTFHDIHDTLTFGDCRTDATLQEVATTHDTSPGRIALLDSIAKARDLRIAVNTAVNVVLIEDNDALLRLYGIHHRRVADGTSHQRRQPQ